MAGSARFVLDVCDLVERQELPRMSSNAIVLWDVIFHFSGFFLGVYTHRSWSRGS